MRPRETNHKADNSIKLQETIQSTSDLKIVEIHRIINKIALDLTKQLEFLFVQPGLSTPLLIKNLKTLETNSFKNNLLLREQENLVIKHNESNVPTLYKAAAEAHKHFLNLIVFLTNFFDQTGSIHSYVVKLILIPYLNPSEDIPFYKAFFSNQSSYIKKIKIEQSESSGYKPT